MDDYTELFLRIALSLERIATALEKKETEKKEEKTVARRNSRNLPIKPKVEGTNLLIATYCEAFKKRYGTNPVIDVKTAAIAKSLLTTLPLEKLQLLVQCYVQIEDNWFKTKCHDFVTFSMNLNRIATSLAMGTQDPHEKAYWLKVFGEGTEIENLMLNSGEK